MAKPDKIMAPTTPLDHIDGSCNVALIGNTGRDRSLQEVMMLLATCKVTGWDDPPSSMKTSLAIVYVVSDGVLVRSTEMWLETHRQPSGRV
jgi:hypothetical protein